jgi:hypothetical protein
LSFEHSRLWEQAADQTGLLAFQDDERVVEQDLLLAIVDEGVSSRNSCSPLASKVR